ncbi:glycosyltransferase [Rhabdaerophilum sp. SD176]|uniref:glycosyltransferase n=1 Tax=Rhabdaerophilum sp. SD176 TaxID=2983548 RepID=UPI0024E01E35|nr:glycosyltransferase [Rhabdaerophilum sp. SD176]
MLAYAEREPVAPLPFSADEIAYLNACVFLGDAPFPLSRATTYFLATPDPTRPTLDLTRAESHEALVAWWAFSKLPRLKAEDFLIPDAYRRVLMRDVRPGAHPVLSMPAFMRYLWANEPHWQTLLAFPEGALPLLYARVLLQSLERPFLLQLLPIAAREHVLADWEARTQPNSVCPFPGRDKIELCLNAVGVSLDDPRSRHFSKEGHRARAFALQVPHDEPLDCQVIGPLDRASGLGQSARLLLEGLASLPMKVAGYPFVLGNPQPAGAQHPHALDRPRPARTHIFHLNPDQLPLALTQMPDMFEGARKVGMFYWELDRPAPGDQLALSLVDEIWVATEFCASIYRDLGKPVHVVGLPIPEPSPLGEEERRRLVRPYLPEEPGIRTILAMYDSLSWIERKNPRMAVDVFRRAFPGRANVRLVLKTHNLERIADPRQRQIWANVQEQALNDPRIIIIDQTMAPDALGALIASADVFLSLHRSEGLGLGLIEAMQRNVPVVATDYSGNRDFCLPDSSWPVAYDLVPVSPGDYAYADGRSRWAEPSADHAVEQLRSALDGDERDVRVARARRHLVEKWSLHAFAARVSRLLA